MQKQYLSGFIAVCGFGSYKSSERMDKILNASDNDYCDKGSIPARSDLTFKNGYYVNITAIFIDIVRVQAF